MCHYSHFTTEEREMSRVLKAQGLSIRAIAKTLNRSPSTVSREFRRNCYANGSVKDDNNIVAILNQIFEIKLRCVYIY